MNIYIRGEKLEITDAMKSYAKEKLERLSKYVKDSDVNANLLFKINFEGLSKTAGTVTYQNLLLNHDLS